MSMPVWFSTPVVNNSCALAGTVELRGIIFATTPPIVSMPRGQRSDVKQQHVVHAAFENIRLDCCAQRNDFVWIQFGVGTTSKKLFHCLPHERDACRSTDQHDFLDIRGREVSRRPAAWRTGPIVRSTSGRIKRSYSAREISRKIYCRSAKEILPVVLIRV